MRVLVAHASRFGSTREIAERIGVRLRAAGLDATVADATHADPAAFDAVVLGSGVYGGHWAPAMMAMIRRYAKELSARPVWLFSSGPIGGNPGYRAKEPAEVADVSRILRPRDHRIFWGAWDRANASAAEMGRIERFASAHFLPEGDFRDWPEIESWADAIARELAPH